MKYTGHIVLLTYSLAYALPLCTMEDEKNLKDGKQYERRSPKPFSPLVATPIPEDGGDSMLLSSVMRPAELSRWVSQPLPSLSIPPLTRPLTDGIVHERDAYAAHATLPCVQWALDQQKRTNKKRLSSLQDLNPHYAALILSHHLRNKGKELCILLDIVNNAAILNQDSSLLQSSIALIDEASTRLHALLTPFLNKKCQEDYLVSAMVSLNSMLGAHALIEEHTLQQEERKQGLVRSLTRPERTSSLPSLAQSPQQPAKKIVRLIRNPHDAPSTPFSASPLPGAPIIQSGAPSIQAGPSVSAEQYSIRVSSNGNQRSYFKLNADDEEAAGKHRSPLVVAIGQSQLGWDDEEERSTDSPED